MGEHRAQDRESLASGAGGLDVTVDRTNSDSHRDRFHCPLISGFWVPNQAGAQTSFIQEDGNETFLLQNTNRGRLETTQISNSGRKAE